MVLVGVIATSCIVLSAVLIAGGAGRREAVELAGGFTAHLDLDKGALGALVAAANMRPSGGGESPAFTDAVPRMPAVLKSRFNSMFARAAGSEGDDEEMLSSFSHQESRQQQAVRGMSSTDYEDLTDAAGEERR